MDRADALMGCTENSLKRPDLAALTNVIEAYERQRAGRTAKSPAAAHAGLALRYPAPPLYGLGQRRNGRHAWEAVRTGASGRQRTNRLCDRILPDKYNLLSAWRLRYLPT